MLIFILILIVAFGVLFSAFATQNTNPASLYIGPYSLSDIPIYMVILATLFLGLVSAGLVYLIYYLSSSLTISDKDKQLKNLKKDLVETTKMIHKLELENTKLKAKLGEDDFDDDSIR